jgi:threonine efflux protein
MDPVLATPIAAYGAFILGLISPGPDFVLVTALALGKGRRPALFAAAGIATGVALWVMAAAAGLGTLIETAPEIWEGVRLAGGGLLIYMGARTLSAAIRNADSGSLGGPEDKDISPFVLGLLTNMANPKAAVVLVGLTAVLAEANSEPVALMGIVLGMPVLTLTWFSLVATALARAASRDRFLSCRRALNLAMGAVLAAVGVLLIQPTGAG